MVAEGRGDGHVMLVAQMAGKFIAQQQFDQFAHAGLVRRFEHNIKGQPQRVVTVVNIVLGGTKRHRGQARSHGSRFAGKTEHLGLGIGAGIVAAKGNRVGVFLDGFEHLGRSFHDLHRGLELQMPKKRVLKQLDHHAVIRAGAQGDNGARCPFARKVKLLPPGDVFIAVAEHTDELVAIKFTQRVGFVDQNVVHLKAEFDDGVYLGVRENLVERHSDDSELRLVFLQCRHRGHGAGQVHFPILPVLCHVTLQGLADCGLQ